MKSLMMLLVLVVSTSAAQVSDFETVRAFERETKRLSTAIDSAKTVQECADIRVSIEALKTEYADHKALLDKSLYGENFDQRFESMSGKLILAERKLGVIESQIARIVDLETQVRELSGRVDQLTSQNAELMANVDRMSQNIKGLSEGSVEAGSMIDSLKGVIGKLQRGIRERDEMIFALVDSLFMQYNKDLTAFNENEMQGVAIKLDRNNVVSGVITSIENNIRFLDQAQLSGSDLSSIIDEHARFSSQWKGVGPKLASIYVSKKRRAQELAYIDTLLGRWSMKADEAQWRELNRAFSAENLPVVQFSNGEEFVHAMSAFVDAQMESNGAQTERDSSWARFDRLWSGQLSGAWLPLLVRRENISQSDADMLTAKVETWRSEMTPTSPFVYALIFIVIVALLAVGYTRFIRNKPVGSA